MVGIREDYDRYSPPTWVMRTTRELVASVSAEKTAGLSIVLTESARMPKGKTHRVGGRKYAMKECLGFYRGRWRGDPATVFIIVDNVIARRSWWFWHLPLSRDVVLGAVLFHEIGHHLNATIGSLAGGEEASADNWERRLSRLHLRTKCRYLRPVRAPLRFVLRTLIRSMSG
jgi:hypothetical protein